MNRKELDIIVAEMNRVYSDFLLYSEFAETHGSKAYTRKACGEYEKYRALTILFEFLGYKHNPTTGVATKIS